MKKVYLSLFCLLTSMPFIGLSQARLVINGTTPVYMVENGGTAATPIYIEVANSATNAITEIGTQGWIVSESEFNMVKWDIAAQLGSYVVPFGYSTTDYLPLTYNVTIPGTSVALGSGTVKFSTYHSTADNWTCCAPTGVTNMDPMAFPGSPSNTDNSYNVVDRFWILDANTGYTLKPQPIITFSYIDGAAAPSEVIAPNIFAENTLLAQRFNTTLGTWGDFLGGAGTDVAGPPVGTCTTGAAAVSSANFFRAWTLSSSTDPLPIQLSDFNVNCNNGVAVLTWTTQSEINNNFFTVERSGDGVNYDNITTIPGAGNSSTTHNYTATDPNPLPGTSYYRLAQTDFDGNVTNYTPIPFTGCQVNGTTISAFTANGNIVIRIDASIADNYNISLVNMLGQTILTNERGLPAGYNEFSLSAGNITHAIYVINIRSNNANYSKKLVLGAY